MSGFEGFVGIRAELNGYIGTYLYIYIYKCIYVYIYISIYMYRGFFGQGMGFQYFGLGAWGVLGGLRGLPSSSYRGDCHGLCMGWFGLWGLRFGKALWHRRVQEQAEM